MLRYALELYNADARAWVRLPNYSADSMTEALCFGLSVFDGLQLRAVPLMN